MKKKTQKQESWWRKQENCIVEQLRPTKERNNENVQGNGKFNKVLTIVFLFVCVTLKEKLLWCESAISRLDVMGLREKDKLYDCYTRNKKNSL